jgi:hypothetical protein
MMTSVLTGVLTTVCEFRRAAQDRDETDTSLAYVHHTVIVASHGLSRCALCVKSLGSVRSRCLALFTW